CTKRRNKKRDETSDDQVSIHARILPYIIFVSLQRGGRMRVAAFTAIVVAIVFCVFADPADERPATKLAGRALGSTSMMSDLEEMCDQIGGSPTGSTACQRSIDWAVEKFKAAGVDSVSTEEFSVPLLWLGGTAEASVTAPEKFSIRLVSAVYAPSTPANGIDAKVVDAGFGRPEDYARLGASAHGAIALVHQNEMKSLEELFDEYIRNSSVLAAGQKAEVAAILLQSSQPRGLLYRHPVTFGEHNAPMPVAVISREQGERISRLAATSEVRMHLNLQNRTGGPYTSKNVVAEIRGSEKPDEIVLLGAHLDSWELGTGANDNGVNCAMVI